MESDALTPSILPYLQPEGAGFYLDFRLQEGGSDSSYPFAVLTDSSPCSRLLDGRILSDTGSEICRASILLQKDRYVFAGQDALWPLNNLDIEKAWNQAFLSERDLLLGLRNQVREGKLLPFQSLFFCRQTNRFFHPICPRCAQPLDQCRDDERLVHFHLESYSTSLKRYLFCPSCGDGSDFYVFEREGSDPPELNDRWGLIKGFGPIVESGIEPEGFPCTGCGERKSCYGEKNTALSRIVPFSFYPFYMLLLRPVSVSSTDFLNLLSGAPSEELAARYHRERREGRAACLSSLGYQTPRTDFLFETGESRFLEVLYLKLSFLAEVSEMILSGSWGRGCTDPGFSTERVWVSLPEQSGYLPFYWNFKTRWIDPVAAHIQPNPFTAARPPSREGLQFFGRLWFYAMLMNKSQDVAKVNECVTREAGCRISRGTDPAATGGVLEDGLSPRNLFWEPAEPGLTDRSRRMWDRAIDLGMTLLTTGMGANENWSSEPFREDLRLLRESIREALFQGRAAVQPTARPEEDQAISEIIARMMVLPPEKPDQEGETRRALRPAGASKDERPRTPPEAQAGISKPEPRRAPPVKKTDRDWAAEDTIVFSVEDFAKHTSPKEVEEEESLPKTLTRQVIAPSEANRAGGPDHAPDPLAKGKPLSGKGADDGDEDDHLEETITFKGKDR